MRHFLDTWSQWQNIRVRKCFKICNDDILYTTTLEFTNSTRKHLFSGDIFGKRNAARQTRDDAFPVSTLLFPGIRTGSARGSKKRFIMIVAQPMRVSFPPRPAPSLFFHGFSRNLQREWHSPSRPDIYEDRCRAWQSGLIFIYIDDLERGSSNLSAKQPKPGHIFIADV